MKKTKVYLSLGSNIGNKYYYILGGIFGVSKIRKVRVTKVSKFYTTNPVGYLEQDLFLNCAIELETTLNPRELLEEIQKIELEFKRKRTIKWGPRTLDIDIILFGNLKINEKDLIIPHERYLEREFVLIPLLDIVEDSKKGEIKKNIICGKNEIIEEKTKKVLVSRCLLGEEVSYKKNHNYNYMFSILKEQLEFIKICPEVDGGLPTPRPSAEINGEKVIDINGKNVTNEFELGGNIAKKIAEKNNIDLAFLKGKSPSCGIGKIYDGTFSKNLVAGNGITVRKLLELGVEVVEVNKCE